jgi:hypothetical protein
VVDINSPLFHDFFQVAVRDRISNIEKYSV